MEFLGEVEAVLVLEPVLELGPALREDLGVLVEFREEGLEQVAMRVTAGVI